MPNEEGEFELVLGNKQLLSVLFIVVVLLGVFFAMGYIVGRNSAPVETSRRAEPYVRTDAQSAMPERRPPPAQQPKPVLDAQPQAGAPAATREPERPKPAEVSPVSTAQPETGQTFLQVSAVAKAEAEILSELLVKKGFRATVAAGPNDKLFRVLVGPAKDTAELSKMKNDLEEAGFKSIVRKY
jgi:cell division protein FtsN